MMRPARAMRVSVFDFIFRRIADIGHFNVESKRLSG